MLKTISWHLEDNIGFIELNKPPANDMTKLFFHEFRELADEILNKEEIKAIIIGGRGRHFSSGADIHDLLSFDSENKEQMTDFYMANSQTFKRFFNANIPVIAVIKGVCIGSAMELAMACHFRIVANNVMMGFPESGFNLMTGCGGSVYLSKIVDKKTSIELLLKGTNFSASEAKEMGLADMVVMKGELFQKAVTFANQVYENYNPGLRNYYIEKYLKN